MGRTWLAVACVVAAVTPASLYAQTAEVSSPSVPSDETIAALPLEQRFPTLLMYGRYFDAFEQIDAASPDEVADRLRSSYRQMRPALDGFFYKDPAEPPLPLPDPAELAAYDGATAEDAIRAIIERARDRRVVIVNEAHDSPRDRAFILRLAQALKPLGFTHYAAETFVNQTPELAESAMEQLTRNGYPVHSTGYYTNEPMFGYLVRGVMALGYRPVVYEARYRPEEDALSREEQIASREQAQAENLARALAAAGPEARFLIHVGYGHAAERPPPGEAEWMAAPLVRLAGLDPLTIDQTGVSEVALTPQGRALHHALVPRLDEASAIFMKDGAALASGRMGAGTDLQVVHPLVTVVDGRPGWLRDTGRVAVVIPKHLLPSQGRRLVQAFVAGEAADAIPLDQALVTAGLDPPVIYVPRNTEIRWAVQE